MGGPGSGAPLGNNNRAKGKMFRQALARALAKKHGSLIAGLDQAAEILRADAIEKKNIESIKDIADRFDDEKGHGTNVQVNVLVISPQSLAVLTDDELDALERALPALERLGAVTRSAAVREGEAGEPEET